ncbi:hypothetical protein Gpo141_00005865, partial [Globisporangium polare]
SALPPGASFQSSDDYLKGVKQQQQGTGYNQQQGMTHNQQQGASYGQQHDTGHNQQHGTGLSQQQGFAQQQQQPQGTGYNQQQGTGHNQPQGTGHSQKQDAGVHYHEIKNNVHDNDRNKHPDAKDDKQHEDESFGSRMMGKVKHAVGADHPKEDPSSYDRGHY